MMRKIVALSLLLVIGLIVFTSCNPSPTSAPMANTLEISTSTEVPNTPTPTEVDNILTPTEEPILLCNITFESDRDGNIEIYTMGPDGSNQVNLTKNPGDDFDPVWSPDGTYIAFASNRENGEQGGQFIYIMLANGNDVTQASHQYESNFPDWSPLGSQITYSSKGDIYLINIFEDTEVNLTNSPEWDEQPKFSPDGQRIAWLKDEGNSRQIYIMDLDGSNVAKVTIGGDVKDLEWTIDGRLFTHWDQPEGTCFNCVVTTDGKEVINAGGKGTIQQYLPFWTAEGDRVELGAGDVKGTGHDDIFLVSEIYPDMFKYLTSDSGNNRSPDTAAMCGPYHGANPPAKSEPTEASAPNKPAKQFTVGYTGAIDPVMQMDFDQACSELKLECVHGENITELVDKDVSAIVNASNRWDVLGSYPAIHDAASRGIPLFILNAESDEPGVYNLSAENEIYTTTLSWMFKSMNDQGEVAFYNFGKSDYLQRIVDGLLKDYPGIIPINYTPDYVSNPFNELQVQTLIAQHPNLGAIWSSDPADDLFWGVVDKANSHMPLIDCPARKDILIAWKNELDAGSPLRCISYVRPGGTAYEGIYVAYYYLSGLKLNPEKLAGEGHNTLHYSVPEITNENLSDWLLKLDTFRGSEKDLLQLQPMSPEHIKTEWFLE